MSFRPASNRFEHLVGRIGPTRHGLLGVSVMIIAPYRILVLTLFAVPESTRANPDLPDAIGLQCFGASGQSPSSPDHLAHAGAGDVIHFTSCAGVCLASRGQERKLAVTHLPIDGRKFWQIMASSGLADAEAQSELDTSRATIGSEIPGSVGHSASVTVFRAWARHDSR